jgi:endonuclease/exonuclease/phosphatase (EEP) superfamily protein YafD
LYPYTQQNRSRTWLSTGITALATVYLLVLFAWSAGTIILGDRWWWLFLINALSLYLFVPLPAVVVAAAALRRGWLMIGAGCGIALGLWFYGSVLIMPPGVRVTGPTLTVMSYNMWAPNPYPERIVAAIRDSGADVVGLQELSLEGAEAIERELATMYPYQLLDPQPTVRGMGIISRYPLRALPVPDGWWVGLPQVAVVDFEGTEVTLLNFHAIPPTASLGRPRNTGLTHVVREREAQARSILALATARPGPFIALGDLNATPRNAVHRILTADLVDAWEQAGRGFGHTWPGAPGDDQVVFAGIPAPAWLVRIDYVFHSRHWATAAARTGLSNNGSDHRPVIAALVLESR